MQAMEGVVQGELRRGRLAVDIAGDPALVDLLRGALLEALGGRLRTYRVHIESVGRCGDVLIAIEGLRGRLPLLFNKEDLAQPAYVGSVVRSTVDRFSL